MEFIFRTLVEMKIDLEDLRTEFERFRRRHPELTRATGQPAESDLPRVAIEIGGGELAEHGPSEEGGAYITIHPGMKMADIEREAIRVALEQVNGNRRKAAEQLGIGERTLYRKLREYALDA